METQENIDESYLAVVNDEGQYSIWSADSVLPPGWKSAGRKGTRAECLAYIKVIWTDMRPLNSKKPCS
jgi:MbtH protein